MASRPRSPTATCLRATGHEDVGPAQTDAPRNAGRPSPCPRGGGAPGYPGDLARLDHARPARLAMGWSRDAKGHARAPRGESGRRAPSGGADLADPTPSTYRNPEVGVVKPPRACSPVLRWNTASDLRKWALAMFVMNMCRSIRSDGSDHPRPCTRKMPACSRLRAARDQNVEAKRRPMLRPDQGRLALVRSAP